MGGAIEKACLTMRNERGDWTRLVPPAQVGFSTWASLRAGPEPRADRSSSLRLFGGTRCLLQLIHHRLPLSIVDLLYFTATSASPFVELAQQLRRWLRPFAGSWTV